MFRTGRSLLVATLVSLCAAGSALAMDKLVQRDMDAFAGFVRVRCESLEAAIARKDVQEARALAGRIHDEECRFLERVVRYLRDARNPGVASELESYLDGYRQISLKDSVRMRRAFGPGRVPLAELALAALTGARVSMAEFALPSPSGAPHHAEPPPGPPPGYYPGAPANPGIGTPVPSLPAAQTTAKLLNAPKVGTKTIQLQKADLSDQDPALLASHPAKAISLESLRAHTGTGIGGSPLPQSSVLEGADSDGALASSIRVPGGSSGATGSGLAKAPVASQTRIAPAAATAQIALPAGLRRGQ